MGDQLREQRQLLYQDGWLTASFPAYALNQTTRILELALTPKQALIVIKKMRSARGDA